MLKNYKHTVFACYIGYITQAIANNFAPLLFITFNKSFNLPLSKVGLLVSINFFTQILVDAAASKFVDKIGYRAGIILSHVFTSIGLITMGILPYIISPYIGLCISVVLYAIGGGLSEVIVSPIVEACPGEEKEAAMSLLHSFYCWGCVAVVLLSTLCFNFFGINNWRWISIGWSLIPIFNIFYFSIVPINTLVDKEKQISTKKLLSSSFFWILILLMLCSGACEQAMSQWASAFAESGLKVNKTLGDIAGPCMFSILMGCSRVFHSKFGTKYSLTNYLLVCAFLCLFSYLIAVFAPHPAIGLLGCGLCGLSVGAMWPGSFSLASKTCPNGGTLMFAYLALAGDLGCGAGPSIVGFVSSKFSDSLKHGLFSAIIFPLTMIFILKMLKKQKQ